MLSIGMSIPIPRLEKGMLCVWQDYKRSSYWKLFPSYKTVNKHARWPGCGESTKLCSRRNPTNKLKSFCSLITQGPKRRHCRNCSPELRTGFQPNGGHPSYSTTLASTDFHLFRSIGNRLRDFVIDADKKNSKRL